MKNVLLAIATIVIAVLGLPSAGQIARGALA